MQARLRLHLKPAAANDEPLRMDLSLRVPAWVGHAACMGGAMVPTHATPAVTVYTQCASLQGKQHSEEQVAAHTALQGACLFAVVHACMDGCSRSQPLLLFAAPARIPHAARACMQVHLEGADDSTVCVHVNGEPIMRDAQVRCGGVR